MTARNPRRNNAPVRPRRPATGVPDLVFAIAMAMATMGAIFYVATFVVDDLSTGDAGTQIARIFGGLLVLTAILTALIGILLLRGDRRQTDHYVVPVFVGAIIGGLEAAMFLNPGSALLLLAPLLLLFFVLRPVRRSISRAFGAKGRR